jgi:hypothetical protein
MIMTTCLLLTQLSVKKTIQQFGVKPCRTTGTWHQSSLRNIDINKDPSIIQFFKEERNLDYIPTSSPTTLGNTTIDLAFVFIVF